jgi:serine/threonine protein kinase
MGKPTATLEDIGVMMGVPNELPETNVVEPQLPRRAGPMRFAYPSGSRPLDGFTIKRGIGIGGFGEVYFATSDAGKEVALKHIQRHLDIELRGVTQCLNLKHVNLLALYDIKYDSAGEAWVIMEYVGGESLKDTIDRHPQGMPWEEISRWFEGMAAGVKYLHDHGIVHRDLKPGNIFADGDTVKIGDYGLSKFISCSRRSGQTESVGTFHYMAPEIGRGVYGKEIDVYALGIMLHEMLTGQVPFDGETSQEIIMRHLTADPDLSRVPAPFVPIIRKSLAKDPQHRYPSVAILLEDVRKTRGGNDAPARSALFGKKSPQARQGESDRQGVRGDDVRERPIFIHDEGVGDEGIFLGPLRENLDSPSSAAARGSAPVSSPSPSSARSLPDEPIARAVFQSLRRVGEGFRAVLHDCNSPTKVFLVILLGLAVFAYGGFLIPLAVAALVLYLVYYGVRSLVLASGSHSPPRQLVRRDQLVASAREACRRTPAQQRLAELIGSMLMATVVCVVLSFACFLLLDNLAVRSVGFWASYLWLALTGLLGTWTLLLLGKAWEGSTPEPRRRRLYMLGAGLILGLFAYYLAEYLQMSWGRLGSAPRGPQAIQPTGWYSLNGMPQLAAFLAYFAGLMLVPGWWRQVDPLRETRLRLVSVVAVVGWAWILHLILYFPQPAGMTLAAMMAIAAQMSAPQWDLRHMVRPSGQARGVSR